VNWNRKLWGVQMIGADGARMLIGFSWHAHKRDFYHGEPTRALLFCTRDAARAWCRDKMREYAGHSHCKRWRFRPVRVREIVKPV
jgi:hypothetical protein